MCHDSFMSDVAIGYGVISHQTCLLFIGFRDDHSTVDTRTLLQRRFNLPKLDTKTSHLHLKIIATKKFNVAIRQPTPQIASAIHARIWFSAKWIRNKALLGQTFEVKIPTGYPLTTNHNFSNHTNWSKRLLFINNIHLCVT